MPIRRTSQEAPGRLFPTEFFSELGWGLSAQGDNAGYQCSPRERLETLEEYEEVEVVIYGPEGIVDPAEIGIPTEIANKFTVGRDGDFIDYAIGCNITQNELEAIRGILMRLSQQPAPNPEEDDDTEALLGEDIEHGGDASALAVAVQEIARGAKWRLRKGPDGGDNETLEAAKVALREWRTKDDPETYLSEALTGMLEGAQRRMRKGPDGGDLEIARLAGDALAQAGSKAPKM